MTLVTPARLGLMSALCLVGAAVLAFSDDAWAAASPCDDQAAMQRRLDDFDTRWNASDAAGLTALFATEGSLGAAGEPGRQAVYRAVVERLGRAVAPRHTRLVRSTTVGAACLLDVAVRSADRQEAGLFLLEPGRDGGILAMR